MMTPVDREQLALALLAAANRGDDEGVGALVAPLDAGAARAQLAHTAVTFADLLAYMVRNVGAPRPREVVELRLREHLAALAAVQAKESAE